VALLCRVAALWKSSLVLVLLSRVAGMWKKSLEEGVVVLLCIVAVKLLVLVLGLVWFAVVLWKN